MEQDKKVEAKTTNNQMVMSKKKFWGLMVLSFFAGAILMASGDTEDVATNEPSETTLVATPEATQTPTAEPTKSEKQYQEIFELSGTGPKTSEPFTITGEKFRLRYNCTGSLCQGYLYEVGNDLPVQLVMNSTEEVHDETIVYGSGQYYLTSNSIGNFFILVDDYK